ncbi:MAG TPA: methyltransferase type 11 [Actinobacteria bacterium]|nr:methyltransferase type 11 [Actinomycetota bacterium]
MRPGPGRPAGAFHTILMPASNGGTSLAVSNGTYTRTMSGVAAPSTRVRHARGLFADLGPAYDRMGAALSFGQDPRWRRFMVSRVRVPVGGLVLDVATGTALVSRQVARRTGARVVGLDQSAEMVRSGMANARRESLNRSISFVLGDGQRLPFADETFDALTFTYLLRYVDDPATTLTELARVVKPGGTVANLEFHVPPNPVWRWLWVFYTRAVMPVVGRMVSKEWAEVGRFLGGSISSFYERLPLTDQLAAWRRAGILDVRARVMSLGGGVVIWGAKDAAMEAGAA